MPQNLTLTKAKAWFEAKQMEKASTKSSQHPLLQVGRTPDWADIYLHYAQDAPILEMPLKYDDSYQVSSFRDTHSQALKIGLTRILLKENTDGSFTPIIMRIYADSAYLAQESTALNESTFSQRAANFSGEVHFFDWEENFLGANHYQAGQFIGSLVPSSSQKSGEDCLSIDLAYFPSSNVGAADMGTGAGDLGNQSENNPIYYTLTICAGGGGMTGGTPNPSGGGIPPSGGGGAYNPNPEFNPFIDPGDNTQAIPLFVIAALRAMGQAAVGVITDIAVQYVVEYYFGGHDDWTSAWNTLNIDWWQAISSGGEALVANPHTSAAISAGNDMLSYILTSPNPTFSGAIQEAGIGAISSYLGAGGLKAVKIMERYGSDTFFRSLKNLRGETEAVRYVWQNIDALDTYANGRKIIGRGTIFEDMLSRSRYQTYQYVGKRNNGYFKYIDFYKNGQGISLKTTNASTASGKQSFVNQANANIDDMVNMRTAGVHPDDPNLSISSVKLEIGVPENYDTAWLNAVINYGSTRSPLPVEVSIFIIK